MRLITHTNIIVDDFGYCKSFPQATFIHFLTHFHSDHWQGLTPLWNYGPIYCTPITKRFILNKFPKINNIVECEYQKEYTLHIGRCEDSQLVVKYYFFDAKHIPGAAMILFDGFMGRVLFTGDFRYNFSMVLENPILFPLELREGISKDKIKDTNNPQWVQKQQGISLQIDELILDNTYCNEMFRFQKEDEIVAKMIKIITQNYGKKVFISMSALGKESLLFRISKHFQTSICIKQEKLKKIQISGGPSHIFTTNPEESFIEVISKKNRKDIISEQLNKKISNFICIDTDFLMIDHHAPDKINFTVPYSLHSNYSQMSTFVRMIKPGILRKIVIPFEQFKAIRFNAKIDNRLRFAKYIHKLEQINKSKSGFSYLISNYTDIKRVSKKYLNWMKPNLQQQLVKMLGLVDPDHSLRKRKINLELKQFEKGKKQSLKQIADQMKATHMNQSLQIMLEDKEKKKKQSKLQEIFYQIFTK